MEPYSKSFDQLKIVDEFATATGLWIVYDKGTRTIVAHRKDQDSTYELTAFETFDFPTDSDIN